jgi:hypothetical protein
VPHVRPPQAGVHGSIKKPSELKSSPGMEARVCFCRLAGSLTRWVFADRFLTDRTLANRFHLTAS